MKKRAIILFNLGGPESLAAVRPFLLNLFSDKNIIPLPAPLRYPLAYLISALRNRKAQKIYQKTGGRSPILPETEMQARALEKKLNEINSEFRNQTFIAMRYRTPRLAEIIEDVKNYKPDEIVLLPLYPQFSTTTTRSSFEEWNKIAAKHFPQVKITPICCYPQQEDFISAHTRLILERLHAVKANVAYEILLSAHGIPVSCIEKGDPYQYQVEVTAKEIEKELRKQGVTFPVRITYQSKVGPAKWLSPSTEAVIEELSRQGKGIVTVPVAFVSEHSETLVELDMDYAELAKEKGAADYLRVPALRDHPDFIAALVKLITGGDGQFRCGENFHACFQKNCKNFSG